MCVRPIAKSFSQYLLSYFPRFRSLCTLVMSLSLNRLPLSTLSIPFLSLHSPLFRVGWAVLVPLRRSTMWPPLLQPQPWITWWWMMLILVLSVSSISGEEPYCFVQLHLLPTVPPVRFTTCACFLSILFLSGVIHTKHAFLHFQWPLGGDWMIHSVRRQFVPPHHHNICQAVVNLTLTLTTSNIWHN